MAVPRSFTDLVAQYGGFDPDVTFEFLNEWQPYEGGHTNNNATFNYLNTTQDMSGNAAMNDVGVRIYRSEDEGARATAQTLNNGRYGSIVNALTTGDFSDLSGIAGDVRMWTSGSRTGGSNFADALADGADLSYTGEPESIDARAGTGFQAGTDRPQRWSATAGDQLQTILEELITNPPDPNDPRYDINADEYDGSTYQDDVARWTQAVTSVTAASQDLRLNAYGLTKLPDGTVIAIGDLSPEQSKAIDDANYNVYAGVMNDLGLADYDVRVGRQKDQNEVTRSNFDNKLKEIEASISFDDVNIARAAKDIDRSLAGLQESRNRADLINDANKQLREWGTAPGKTNYSLLDIAPGLFKASGSNIDPSLISINYTGTTRVDPMAIMDEYDKKLGVNRVLPEVPSLVTDPSQLPKPPTLSPISVPPPSLLAPRPPSLVPKGG